MFCNQEEELFIQKLADEVYRRIRGQIIGKWLRSKDVRKMLGISDATLQTLRVNGAIPSYKLGSSWYYNYDEIIAALESNRTGREDREL